MGYPLIGRVGPSGPQSSRAVAEALFNASVSGVNTLVAAVVGSRIVLHGIVLNNNSPDNLVTVEFRGSTLSAISGAMDIPAGQNLIVPMNEYGWLQTAIGSMLAVAVTGLSASAAGHLSYTLSQD